MDSDTKPSCTIEEIFDVPMEPPKDCIQITDDGGVLKHVVTEGSGEAPPLHARCLGEHPNNLLLFNTMWEALSSKTRPFNGQPSFRHPQRISSRNCFTWLSSEALFISNARFLSLSLPYVALQSITLAD
jgi:hypothetical protein